MSAANRSAYVLLFILTAFLVFPSLGNASDDEDGAAQSKNRPVSDDSDSGLSQSANDQSSEPIDQTEIRVGVMEVRPNFDAERFVPVSVRNKIYEYLIKTSEEINARSRVVLPHNTVMKYLSKKRKNYYMKCWLNSRCLAKALKPAKLDIVIASKIRMKEIDPSFFGGSKDFRSGSLKTQEEQLFAQYTLFIKMIDIQKKQTLKKIFVENTDLNRMPDMAQESTRQALAELGLIVEQPKEMVMVTPDDEPETAPVPKPLPEPVRNLGLKIGAWTTLGASVLAGGAGLTFGYLAKDAHDKADNAGSPGEIKDLNEKVDTYKITANVMYGLGGALLATSLTLFIIDWTDSDDSASGAGGGIAVTPDGAFVQFRTEF